MAFTCRESGIKGLGDLPPSFSFVLDGKHGTEFPFYYVLPLLDKPQQSKDFVLAPVLGPRGTPRGVHNQCCQVAE